MTFRALLVLAIFVQAVAGAALAGAQELDASRWAVARAPHVVVFSDAGAEDARSIASRIESFHALALAELAPAGTGDVPAVTVLSFEKRSDLARLKPLYGGAPADFSGLFLPSRERAVVLLDASARGRDTRVVFHEYTHRVLALGEGPTPLWLNEGLAELYSTAAPTHEGVEIGRPIDAHLSFLRNAPLLPISRLVTVGTEDAEYNETRLQGAYYATAWAFAHYWVMRDRARGRAELADFASRLASGDPLVTAFEGAFGRPLAGFQFELERYVKQPAMPRALVAVDSPGTVAIETARAEVAELEAAFGFALALQMRYAEAIPRFERARKADPESPVPYEGLATVERLRGNRSRAVELSREAVRRGSTSAAAHLALVDEGDENALVRDDDARRALERAVALAPTEPRPYAMLSSIARRRGELDLAVAWAERGRRSAPGDGGVELALGLARLALRNFEGAMASFEKVLADEENAAYRTQAAVALSSVTRYLEAISPSEARREKLRMARRPDAPLASFDELPSYFHLTPAGVRGRIRRITCSGRRVVVEVDAFGRRWRYENSKGDEVQFFTLNHNGLELFDCDAATDRDAIVEIEPSRLDPARGTVKAVIFLNPVTPRGAARPPRAK